VIFSLAHWKSEEKDLAMAEGYYRQAAALKEEGRQARRKLLLD